MPLLLRMFNLLLSGPAMLYARWYARRHPEKYGDGWPQRFGRIPARRGDRPCIWIHAVSVGEVNATRSLVDDLQRRLPDHELVVSSTTRTGFEAASRAYSSLSVVHFPLDFPRAVRRTLDALRPNLILLMELEVWPNLLAEAGRRNIPVAIVNGRVTEERSMAHFRKPLLRGVARWMFARLAWIAAQNEAYAARFRELGARPDAVRVVGNLKYDTAVIADSTPGDAVLAAAMGLSRDRPLWVAGSTGPGEEAIVLDAHADLLKSHPTLQLALIPRKPERFDDAAELIRRRGFGCIRRSQRKDDARDAAPPPAGDAAHAPIFLGDTMGELRKFYALADVVFVGRTLVPLGGSDLMEVAGLARPILIGPHTDNFADAAEQLEQAGAAQRVLDAASLAAAVRRLLSDPAAARASGRAGQDVVRRNAGATQRTVELILATLKSRSSSVS